MLDVDWLTDRWRRILVGLLLAAMTLLVFFPLLGAEFIGVDDGYYILNNSRVRAGLTWGGAGWALTSGFQASWHPLTWLSYMLDAQLFGLRPSGFHLTNLLLHVANVLLLFWFLASATSAPWRSAFVAGLFALHPLHVEPVAWIACRKDVLSTFFFLATLLVYMRYTKLAATRPADRNVGATQDAPRSTLLRSYVLTLFLFACGLMSKAMLVTVPCLLLLLDFWPLRRWIWQSEGIRGSGSLLMRIRQSLRVNLPLLREKVPFFLLTIGASVAAAVAMHGERGASVALPLGPRLANGVLACCKYLGQMFWPSGLTLYYPHPGLRLVYELHGKPYPVSAWLTWPIISSLLLLILISAFAMLQLKRWPWLAVGWFWYLGTLVPVSGILQVGSHAMADRYTYIPLVGIFICLVWGVSEGTMLLQTHLRLRCYQGSGSSSLSSFGGEGRGEEAVCPQTNARGTYTALACVGLAAILACAAFSRKQVGYWQNDRVAFEHALAVTADPGMAFYHIGGAFAEQGNRRVAMALYRASIATEPGRDPGAYLDLGALLEQEGKTNEALAIYDKALRAMPWAAQVHNHLGNLFSSAGRAEEALNHYRAAVQARDDYPDAHYNLGVALASQHQWSQAAEQFAAVVRLKPDDAEAHASLAETLLNQDKPSEAEHQFQEAIRLCPTNAAARLQLGMLCMAENNSDEALAQFKQAAQLRPDWPEALNALAWLLATHPRADHRDGAQAVRLAERACALVGDREPRFWSTLDCAYAEAGRFSEAIVTAEKARQLALASGRKELAEAAETRLALYRAGKAFHQ